MSVPAAGLALGVPLIAALALSRAAFTGAVVVIASLVLVDLSGLLARAAARPVVLAALLPAVALPVVASVAEDGWLLVPPFAAAAVLVAFALMIAFGRRAHVVETLGSTAAAVLVVGLGATTLVLLRTLPSGRAWVLALLGLVVAADLGAPLARALQSRGSEGGHGLQLPRGEARTPVIVPAVLVAVAVGVAVLVWPGGAAPAVVAALGVVALTASRGADELLGLLTAESGIDIGSGSGRLGEGPLLAAADGLLLAAPATYVIVRAVSL